MKRLCFYICGVLLGCRPNIQTEERTLSVTIGGVTDTIPYFVARPEGVPRGVVIFGHGQGIESFASCDIGRLPRDVDAELGRRVATELAEEGYLVASVFYRNRDPNLPLGTFAPRDSGVRDTTALLSVAQELRTDQGAEMLEVAFLGHSMGTFPVTWAASTRAEFAPLQGGLEIRTAITTGMLGNLWSNAGNNALAFTSNAPEEISKAVLAGLLLDVPIRAIVDGTARVDETSLEVSQGVGLTAQGRDLFAALALSAPPATAACDGAPVALCRADCASEVFAAKVNEAGGLGAIEDWLNPEAIEVFASWLNHSADASEPSAVELENPLLANLIENSPAYRLGGFVSQRFLPIASRNDHVLVPQGDPVGQQFAQTLVATGVTIPSLPQLNDDRDGICDHDDYLNPKRDCGWEQILGELSVAFTE